MTTGESSSNSSSLHLYGDLSTVIDIDTKKLLSSSDAFSDRIPGFSRSYSSSSNFDDGLSHHPNSVPFQVIKNDLQDVINRSAVLSTLVNKGENLAFSLNTTARTELEVLDEIRLQVGERSTEVASEAQVVITRVKDRLVSQAKLIAENHPEEVHEIEDLVAKVSARTDDLARNMGRSLKSGLSATYQGLKRLYSDVVEFETKLGLLPEAPSDDIGSRYGRARTLPQPALDPRLNFSIGNSPKSDRSTLIGIIDSGFNAANPDIDPSRLILGQDRIDQDANPLIKEGEGSEHGTAMLGIIGATQHNGVGIDGIDATSPIWLGRAIGSGKVAASIAEFVDYAKQAGYKNAVLNLSMDLTQTNADGSVSTRTKLTDQERAAIAYAKQNHVIVVVAAGNNGGAVSSWNQAAQDFDNVVLVGSADGDQRAAYSDTGAGLSLVAFGGTVDNPVISTMHNGIGKVAGTSVASARVTGAVSLLQASNPDLNYRQVIDILEGTAQDIGTLGFDAQTGNGVVNVRDAIALAKVTPSEFLVESPLNFPHEIWQSVNGTQASEREADWLGDAGNLLKKAADDTIHTVQKATNDVVDTVKGTAADIIHTVEKVGETLKPVSDAVQESTKEVITTVSEVVDEIKKDVNTTTNNLTDNINQTVKHATDGASETVKDIIDDVTHSPENLVNHIIGNTIDVVENIKNAVTDTVEDLKNDTQTTASDVISNSLHVLEVIDERKDNLESAIIHTISDAKESAIDSVNNAVTDLSNQVKRNINNFVDQSLDSIEVLDTGMDILNNQAIDLTGKDIYDWSKDIIDISLGDTSKLQKTIRTYGEARDKDWTNLKPSWSWFGDVIDVPIGMGKAVLEMVDGIATIRSLGVTHSYPYYIFHPEKLDQDIQFTQKGLEYISQNPNAILEGASKIPGALWNGITKSYTDAWNSGHPGQAIGRGIVDIGSMFIGVGEAGKAGKAAEMAGQASRKSPELLGLADDVTRMSEKVYPDIAKVANESNRLNKAELALELTNKNALSSKATVGDLINSLSSTEKSNLENTLRLAKSPRAGRASQGRAFDKYIQEQFSSAFDQGVRSGQDPIFYKREFFHYPEKKLRADHAAMITNQSGKEGISIIENKLGGSQFLSRRVLRQAENYGNVVGRNILEGRPAELKYIFAESSTSSQQMIIQDAVNRGIQKGMQEQKEFLMRNGKAHQIPSNVDFKVDFINYQLNIRD